MLKLRILMELVEDMLHGYSIESENFDNLISELQNVDDETQKQIIRSKGEDMTLFFNACRSGNLKAVKYMIENGADIECKCRSNRLYHLNIYQGYEEETLETYKKTCIWIAAACGHLEVVKLLLEAGANVNEPNSDGTTTLLSMCAKGDVDMVKFLLSQGADVSLANGYGVTCLMKSAKHLELCKILLENGAELDKVNYRGETALYYAIKKQKLDSVKLLCEWKADTSIMNKAGENLLFSACLFNCVEIFDYLLNIMNLTLHEIANGYDLLGSVEFEQAGKDSMAIDHWRKALLIRLEHGIVLTVPETEFRSLQDLEENCENEFALEMHSLLVFARVLSDDHNDTIKYFHDRGDDYFQRKVYDKAYKFYLHSFEVRMNLSWRYPYYLFQMFALRFEGVYDEHAKGQATFPPLPGLTFTHLQDFFSIAWRCIEKACEDLSCMDWESSDNCDMLCLREDLECVFFGLTLAMKMEKTAAERKQFHMFMSKFVKIRFPHKLTHKVSLWHVLCRTWPYGVAQEWDKESSPPRIELIHYALDCGADVNEVDNKGNTALHIAACDARVPKRKVCSIFIRLK